MYTDGCCITYRRCTGDVGDTYSTWGSEMLLSKLCLGVGDVGDAGVDDNGDVGNAVTVSVYLQAFSARNNADGGVSGDGENPMLDDDDDDPGCPDAVDALLDVDVLLAARPRDLADSLGGL